MANQIKTQVSLIAHALLDEVYESNVIVQHMNMDYRQDFRDLEVGISNSGVEIITTQSQGPANIFIVGQAVKVNDYKEGSVTLTLDTVIDMTFKFDLPETEFNKGAIARATTAAGRSVLERVEIQILKEIFRAATVISTPSGSLEDQKDFAAVEQYANDAMIPSQERVVFINSATKRSLTSNTNIFTFATTGKEDYTNGLGKGNTDFENGNGLTTEIFGLPIYLSSRLSASYLKSWVLDEIINGTTYVDTATATFVGNDLALQVLANDAFVIKAGSLLKIDTQLVKVSEDVVVTAGAARNVVVKTTEQVEAFPADSSVEIQDLSKFGNFIMSNKAVGFAMKALEIKSFAHQAISYDDQTGISLRVNKEYNSTYKTDMISVDAFIGVKALTNKIAIF